MRQLVGWSRRQVVREACLVACAALALVTTPARAELPAPLLNYVFPAGGQAGTEFDLTVDGANLEEPLSLWFSDGRIGAQRAKGLQFHVTIPAEIAPASVDVRVASRLGISGPRRFLVGNLLSVPEVEPNETQTQAQQVALDRHVDGRLGQPGDIDWFRFSARAGQKVVANVWASRIDSPARIVLELYDAGGQRLAVNRGYWGVDPQLSFTAPSDGDYFLKLFDQTLVGSADRIYRLEIDTKPRTEPALPMSLPLAVKLPPGPKLPLIIDGAENHRLESARPLEVPCDVAGRLAEGDEQDWFALTLKRGEVVWLEAFGERLESPLDLDLFLFNAAHDELAHWSDSGEELVGPRFPTRHTDPAGRFVPAEDGKYYVLVRNVIGDAISDSRRVYRLTVRREEPDFQLTLLPRRADQPTGINVPCGGRECVDVLVERRRGFDGPVRVVANDLPAGVSCPEAWIGPRATLGQLVLSADRTAVPGVVPLHVVGTATVTGQILRRQAAHGTMVRTGRPTGWGRRCDETLLAIASGLPLSLPPSSMAGGSSSCESRSTTMFPLRVAATIADAQVYQDSVVDLAIDLEREANATGPVRVSVVGLTEDVESPVETVAAGESHGWLSLLLPAALPPGPYSIVLKAEFEARGGEAARPTTVAMTTFSNPLTLHVQPGRIHVVVDPSTPKKIARGQVIHIKYQAQRRGGFIGKIHTELAAPGGVEGVRGRGVTFTGQTETGEIQVIATETAPLGPVKFLRLDSVGTVEDRPTYRGGRPLELEITE